MTHQKDYKLTNELIQKGLLINTRISSGTDQQCHASGKVKISPSRRVLENGRVKRARQRL